MSNSTTQANTNTSSASTSDFFDLHVSAFGYLNRYRVVGKGSKQFCAVTVAALRGSKDEVEYTYFDVIIRNKGVCALLANYQDQINDRDVKVLASVTLSDIYAETWGEPAKASIKGRLIGLKSLTVNGETVFVRSTEDAPKPASEPVNTTVSEPESESETIDSEMDKIITELQEPVSESASENLPDWIRLDPSLDSFESDKQNLMNLGYVFDSQQGVWFLNQAA